MESMSTNLLQQPDETLDDPMTFAFFGFVIVAGVAALKINQVLEYLENLP